MKLGIVCCAASLLVCGTAHALPGRSSDPKAALAAVPPIIRKVVEAAGSLRFSGERIVEVNRGMDSSRHLECILRDGSNTRVTFPEDSHNAGQIVVENARERLHYFPSLNEIEVLPPRPDEAFGIANSIKQRHLQFSSSKGDIVAGRQTELGTISGPKGKLLQKLWVDPATGLVLRRQLFGPKGELTGVSEFRKVVYNVRSKPSDFTINIPGVSRVTPSDRSARLARNYHMAAVKIPPALGFQMESVRILHKVGNDVLHQVYIGPRGRLSLFEVNGVVDLNGMRQADQRGFHYHSWSLDGKSYALVGNYGDDDLRRVARSLGER
jgi:outer membrane lipoprotein-sorting protein